MSRHGGGGRTPARVWTEFTRTRVGVNRVTGEETPVPEDQQLWGNNIYNVWLRLQETTEFGPILHLSISRKDRKTIRDWRHLQRIKNIFAGEEREAVEIFPAEDRLVDTSNQFHLWVFMQPGYRLPFGFEDRLVMTPEDLAATDTPGAVQRSFEESR